MQKVVRTAVIAIVLVVIALQAFAVPKSVTGLLTDSMCTKKHMIPGKSEGECVRACVQHGAKYVVVSEGKVYVLDGDVKEFEKLAGEIVSVTGDVAGDKLKVKTIAVKK